MSDAAIERYEPPAIPEVQFSEAKIQLLANTIMPGATAGELQLFVEFARRTGLDAFTKQIYAIRVWDARAEREVFQFAIGIDGLRLIAERTGRYGGQDGPYWKAKGGPWVDLWEEDEPPFAAKVAVFRAGVERPIWGSARFSSFARRSRKGDLIGNWRTMPELMIAKCAEAQALRRAFPRELAGLYVDVDGPESRVMVNPDAPATPNQVGELHRLSKEFGWTDDERHQRAGVGSFRDLTKQQASDLIDAWGIEHATGSATQKVQAGGPDSSASPEGPKSAPEPLDEEAGLPNGVVFKQGPNAGKTWRDLAESHPAELAKIIAESSSKTRVARARAWLEWSDKRSAGEAVDGGAGVASAPEPASADPDDEPAATPEAAGSESDLPDHHEYQPPDGDLFGPCLVDGCGYAPENPVHRKGRR